MAGLLQPGSNCWRLVNAERVALLVDGAAYFQALREVIEQARHSFYILSWDIDSRLQLTDSTSDDDLPPELGDFLNAVVARSPALHGYILDWDFAMLFALDREFLPVYKLAWKTHSRLRFQLDDEHPVGASQHQKIVVVDDATAFVGGLDPTFGRWDTPAHRADEPRRIRPGGEPARPYHDAMMAVSGEAAAALGELARRRWERATGALPAPDEPVSVQSWPPSVEADMENVQVAIVRTEAAYRDAPEIREVEQLYVDSIAAARDYIYIENQYFTAPVIATALESRLRETGGPEIIIVLPYETEGWLAQNSMDVIRFQLLRRLRDHDHEGRLRVYYPHLPNRPHPLNLHAKIMLFDDAFVRVGSANLCNRSMNLDTECDLAIEAAGEARVGRSIAAFRRRLLGEHLDVDAQTLARAEATSSGLIAAIEALRGPGRSLRPFDLDHDTRIGETPLPTQRLADPEQPIDPENLIGEIVPLPSPAPLNRRLLGGAALLVVLVGLLAAWRWSPLAEWTDPEIVSAALTGIREQAYGPLIIIALFIVGGLIAMPLTALIAATVLTYGVTLGFTYSMAGAMLSAVITYALGAGLGRKTVRRLAGQRINAVSRKLGQRGMVAILFVRIVPVAPFTVVNLVAGASHITFRDYVVGSLLGMTPGTLGLALVVDRMVAAIADPSPGTIALFIAVLGGLAAAGYWLNRWIRRRNRAKSASPMPGPQQQAGDADRNL